MPNFFLAIAKTGKVNWNGNIIMCDKFLGVPEVSSTLVKPLGVPEVSATLGKPLGGP